MANFLNEILAAYKGEASAVFELTLIDTNEYTITLKNTISQAGTPYALSNIATAAETLAGTANDHLVTPLGLANAKVKGYANLATFPASLQKEDTIYIAEDTDSLYRWDGAVYAQVGGSSGGVGSNPNVLVDSNFDIDQAVYGNSVSSVATDTYTKDMWKTGASASSFVFSYSGGVGTCTISAGQLAQEVWGELLQTATYTLSWTGEAEARVDGGAFATSPISVSATAGTDMLIEWDSTGTGTVSAPKLELGASATDHVIDDYPIALRKCQYYFERRSCVTGNIPAIGTAGNVVLASGDYVMASPKRSTPAFGYSSLSHFVVRSATLGATSKTATSITFQYDDIITGTGRINFGISASAPTLTNQEAVKVQSGNAGGYFEFDSRI